MSASDLIFSNPAGNKFGLSNPTAARLHNIDTDITEQTEVILALIITFVLNPFSVRLGQTKPTGNRLCVYLSANSN